MQLKLVLAVGAEPKIHTNWASAMLTHCLRKRFWRPLSNNSDGSLTPGWTFHCGGRRQFISLFYLTAKLEHLSFFINLSENLFCFTPHLASQCHFAVILLIFLQRLRRLLFCIWLYHGGQQCAESQEGRKTISPINLRRLATLPRLTWINETACCFSATRCPQISVIFADIAPRRLTCLAKFISCSCGWPSVPGTREIQEWIALQLEVLLTNITKLGLLLDLDVLKKWA